ncbi:uncharacterized protein MONBRDRAFT_12755 [Monosiga brevicollis MX1]|uniref:RNase III domain-containing protein n=1 Tax=Monosiga brevicollis TaxID=81824 RepID=A9VD81_MONBE|nr:uncharacterized protein MONBRDRAFT_12755 [Monosiga brevicollis MX1]EDQ84509.1 predicted protein [Monosiga brevicollis MX1]|eukprot:XP_001750696.1 hypothetical protein [Monosiga brevicollis MX1]
MVRSWLFALYLGVWLSSTQAEGFASCVQNGGEWLELENGQRMCLCPPDNACRVRHTGRSSPACGHQILFVKSRLRDRVPADCENCVCRQVPIVLPRFIMASIPRSGNTWSRDMVELITRRASHSDDFVIAKTHSPFIYVRKGHQRELTNFSDVGIGNFHILPTRNPLDNHDAWLRWLDKEGHSPQIVNWPLDRFIDHWINFHVTWHNTLPLANIPKFVYRFEDLSSFDMRARIFHRLANVLPYGPREAGDEVIRDMAGIKQVLQDRRVATLTTNNHANYDVLWNGYKRYSAANITYVLERTRPALTHGSRASAEQPSNERLEFLGDRVLNLAAAEHLYHAFPKEGEGVLTKKLSAMVNAQALHGMAKRLKLDQHIQVIEGVDLSERTRVLGDAVEALLGAILLDGGWPAALAVTHHLWSISHTPTRTNFKEALQILAQKFEPHELPIYTPRGCDESESVRTWHVRVEANLPSSWWGPIQLMGHGQGTSIKAAEQAAAISVLKQLNIDSEPNEALAALQRRTVQPSTEGVYTTRAEASNKEASFFSTARVACKREVTLRKWQADGSGPSIRKAEQAAAQALLHAIQDALPEVTDLEMMLAPPTS